MVQATAGLSIAQYPMVTNGSQLPVQP
jgi:hypothetical protein